MIEVMDEGIGRVLEKLDADGMAENTIVMFTSDNGPAFFNPPFMMQPGEDSYNERFNAGLKGSKGWVYEGGIRVPMVLRYPGKIPANQMNHDLAHFTDWMPTLMSLCGVENVSHCPLDGHDLTPQLLGERLLNPPRRFWQWNFYYPSIATNAAVRDGDWKLVRPMISGTRYYKNPDLYASADSEARTQAFIEADIREREHPGSIQDILPVPGIRYPDAEAPELYNIADDPGEQNNMADAQPDRVHRLLVELETWFESVEEDRRSIDDPLHSLETARAS
jgi:arylsulfatase A